MKKYHVKKTGKMYKLVKENVRGILMEIENFSTGDGGEWFEAESFRTLPREMHECENTSPTPDGYVFFAKRFFHGLSEEEQRKEQECEERWREELLHEMEQIPDGPDEEEEWEMVHAMEDESYTNEVLKGIDEDYVRYRIRNRCYNSYTIENVVYIC